MVKAVAFMMYPVKDMASARRFYEEALGLKLARIMEEGGQAWAEYDLPGGTFAITTFAEGISLSLHHSRRLLLQPRIRCSDGRARRSVGQHTVASMLPSFAAVLVRLTTRLRGFVTNPRE